MMPVLPLPPELELDSSIGRKPVSLVGPASRGAVYRAEGRPYFFRVLPIAEAPLEFRHEVASAIGLPRTPGIAPVVEAAHDVESGFYFMRYEVSGETTLPQALAAADPVRRLLSCAHTLAALPGWWRGLGHALLPMPADIVLDSKGVPLLLPWRGPHMPDPMTVFHCPTRGIFLAPEIVRGLASTASESTDLYGLGIMLLQCFFRITEGSGEEVLRQAANGRLLSEDQLTSLLPTWMERLPATHEVIAVARRLTNRDPDARARLNPVELAAQLEASAEQMDPLKAVTGLRDRGRFQEAMALLGDILLAQESYDLLVLGGDIAAEDLGTPLQAIDFFERALAVQPRGPEANEGQVRALTALASAGPCGDLLLLFSGMTGILEKLDTMLWRDVQNLSPERQAKVAEPVAKYLVDRQQFARAHVFIYPHMTRGSTWMWWKSELNLAFVASLMGQGKPEEARKHLEQVKLRLRKARVNRSMTEAEIHAYGQGVAELEARIYKLQNGGRA